MGIKDTARSLVYFLMPRYPFVNALTLLMLLAERAKRETVPPFNATYIYVCVGLFFICAFAMSFKELRRPMAILHAIHLLAIAAVVYFDQNMKYRDWVKLRMSHRMLGVAGYYFLFAYFTSSKPRRKILRYLGHALVGIYILTSAYLLLQSPEDKDAFLYLVPGSRPALFVYATLLATIGLCYLPGQFVYDVTQALIVLVGITTVLVEFRMHYWTVRRNLDYWNHFRMVSDNVMILVGAVMYLVSTKKKHLQEEKE